MKRYIYATEDYDPELAFSGDPKVRAQVAQTTTSPELIEIYAGDPKVIVREALAKNPNMSINSLGDLMSGAADDSMYEVEVVIAQVIDSRNPSIEELNTIPSTQLSLMMTWTHSSELISKILSINPSVEIVKNALYNSNTSPEIIRTYYNKLRETLSGNFDHILDSGIHFCLNAIAFNSSTPTDIIQEICDDPTVRAKFAHALAYNVNTPVDVLKELAYDPDEETAGIAKKTLKEIGESL